jgi:hypothetical protein
MCERGQLVRQATYPARSWFDTRLERRDSPIHGRGIFTTAFVRAGERLVLSGGGIFYSAQDWQAGRVPLDPGQYDEVQVDDDLFCATPIDELTYFFNHSCDPNMWGGVAQRDLQPGAEVTTEYALSIFAPDYCLAPCRCGTPLCRQRITGDDWQRSDLQHRYAGHFPPFIERRIQQMR